MLLRILNSLVISDRCRPRAEGFAGRQPFGKIRAAASPESRSGYADFVALARVAPSNQATVSLYASEFIQIAAGKELMGDKTAF